MLMGEYDFTDNFASDETFWLTKVIFVCFVIDMSVVLMNLVLGLAVNDVDSILRDSKVRRITQESATVTYLEKVSLFCLDLFRAFQLGVVLHILSYLALHETMRHPLPRGLLQHREGHWRQAWS